jgi:hypothetical protein
VKRNVYGRVEWRTLVLRLLGVVFVRQKVKELRCVPYQLAAISTGRGESPYVRQTIDDIDHYAYQELQLTLRH